MSAVRACWACRTNRSLRANETARPHGTYCALSTDLRQRGLHGWRTRWACGATWAWHTRKELPAGAGWATGLIAAYSDIQLPVVSGNNVAWGI